jgi:hypothetical protein
MDALGINSSDVGKLWQGLHISELRQFTCRQYCENFVLTIIDSPYRRNLAKRERKG